MKKIISIAAIGISTIIFAFAQPVSAATPPTPSQCSGMTFDNTIVGTPASETLTGTPGRDLIFGMGGSDTISSQGANDCIVTSVNANSRVFADTGNDVVVAQGADWINAGSGNDKVYGTSASAVYVYGADGDDEIRLSGQGSVANGDTGKDTCQATRTVNCEVIIPPSPTPTPTP